MNQHWTVKLDDVAEINPRAPKDIADHHDVAFVPMSAVSEDGSLGEHGTRPYAEVKKGYTYFERGDILVAKITPCFENGKAALVDNLVEKIGFGSTEFHVLRPGSDLDGRYLFYMLWNEKFRTVAAGSMTGSAGQKRVPAELLRRTEIRLPPLDEQRRIAAILDMADALRQKRRRAIALLDSLTQSIFLEMFGEPVLNSKGWPVSTLGDLEDFLTSGSRGWAKYYATEGRAFIRIQNLKAGLLDTTDLAYVNAPAGAETRRTTVKKNDVLISITADLGRVAVVPPTMDGAANINQHLALFRPRGINSTYLAQFLASSGGQRQFSAADKGGVKAGLNFDDIRKIRVLVPPASHQLKFEAITRELTSRLAALSLSANEVTSLFASLQHRAFSGQL